MPKLWNDTIDAHRRAVRETAIETTAALVAEHGLRAVTMSEIAERTGIGRATLYKYFPDVESILSAWHEREINRHLELLAAARDHASGAAKRLSAVLEAYALVVHQSHGHHDAELAALLHRDEQVARTERHLREMVRGLIADAVEAGDVRADVPPDELATYCLHAIAAAGRLASKAAVYRLVAVTIAGLRPLDRPPRRSSRAGTRIVEGQPRASERPAHDRSAGSLDHGLDPAAGFSGNDRHRRVDVSRPGKGPPSEFSARPSR
ncbi:MAG TPA: TetR/AcrR family transcriptional regulator [Candidatus Limnocylindrales bacterium]|nr:TetR/AcrR family transcriptional regulator [Candidatus Limnocylindrales bacterium]